MSKNITIQEGGVGRQFTAQKLTTALIGGGSCNWIPEDEVQLGIKNITDNGTYIAANDGEYGYSQVTVNVSSAEKIITGTTDNGEPVVTTIDVVDGTISEIILGDYFIVTYDGDGNVAKIEDNNGNRCLLTYDGETLSGFDDIEDNHYTIILDSNGNISQVIDPNAQDCELRDSNGDGKIDIISVGAVLEVVPDVETGDIKIIDENDNDVTDDYIDTSISGVDSDNTPWRANITDSTSGGGADVDITSVIPATTPGASITGIDATTGNEVIATVDDNGQIVSESMPSRIEVVTPPLITEYTDGDEIDFNGIEVKGYGKSGDLWTDKYPNGIIPVNDLQYPVRKADIDAATSSWERDVTGTDLVSPVYLVSLNVGDIFGNLPIMSIEGGPVYGMCTPGAHFVIVSLVESIVITARIDGSYPETYNVTRPYTYNERTCYCSQESQRPHGENDIPLSAPQRHTIQEAAAIALLGTSSMEGVQEIPIQYTRSDGNVLESSFDITVSEGSGGGGGGGGGGSPVPEGVTIQDLNIAIYNATNAGLDYIEIDGQQYTIAEAQAMIDYLISH